jgi:hypothetical protein
VDYSFLSAVVVVTVIGSAIAYTLSREHAKSLLKPVYQPVVPLDPNELRSKLHSLLEELIRNREHAAHQYEVGGLSEMKLATAAWDAVKHNLAQLDGSLAAGIQLAYMQVWRFNLIPGGEMNNLSRDGSGLEEFMHELALRAKIALGMAERELSAYLADRL